MNVDNTGPADGAESYLQQAMARLTGMAADYPADRSAAVIGAGTMGAGIAFALMRAGFEVTLSDAEGSALSRAAAWIARECDKAVARGQIPPNVELAPLRTVRSIAELDAPDIVIEAVFESLEVKRSVFGELDNVCPAHTLLGTNTSTLDIDAIAEVTWRPESVVGLHFFSPAHIMPLLEIVRGAKTSADKLHRASALARRLSKTGVIVGNCYGFAGNRMVEGYFREVDRLLLEGVSPLAIDAALEEFGMAMGPCSVLDLVGLDVPYRARSERPDDAARAPADYAVSDAIVQKGWLGHKAGRGIYMHGPGDTGRVVNPDLPGLIRQLAQGLGVAARPAARPEEIANRCIREWSLEAARLVEERIVEHPADADVIAALGYGFPRTKGGPLCYGKTAGIIPVVS
jgi:3-hydroxyacyl-CoA dehydrogenase